MLSRLLQFVPKLKWLTLKGSRHLVSISKRIHAPLIEKIDLEDCIELLDFPTPDKSSLKQLCELNLMYCRKVKQLPTGIRFESLVSLRLDYSNLETFQEDTLVKSNVLRICSMN